MSSKSNTSFCNLLTVGFCISNLLQSVLQFGRLLKDYRLLLRLHLPKPFVLPLLLSDLCKYPNLGRPKIYELNFFILASQTVYPSETLNDTNWIPVNIIID